MLSLTLPIIESVPEQADHMPAWFGQDASEWHVFYSENQPFLLVTDQSRIYRITPGIAKRLSEAVDAGGSGFGVSGYRSTGCGESGRKILQSIGIDHTGAVNDIAPESTSSRSLSLAIAQKCNLGCTYCYAQEGDFGGQAKSMPLDVALAAVEFLFLGKKAGERLNLSFLGGEPLMARETLRAATQRGVELSHQTGIPIGFSITTNGTLLTLEDGEFFEQHGFAVTVSLDGVGETHDRLRSFKGGRGSYDRILNNVRPLLAMQQRMQLTARVTVTPRNLELPETLDTLISLGFHSVGFSPMLSSPTGRDQMESNELQQMLEQMIACGQEFERRVMSGERYPFSNLGSALREIHRGTHRPYSCGAGAGYLGVSADGELSACHRFVGDSAGQLGHIDGGVDEERQSRWLKDRHVHRQEPCTSCWARYLCGGGCHHEVIHRGRPACDYIRGWLHYCLEVYARLLVNVPEYFEAAS
jgi:uncharacterized protein